MIALRQAATKVGNYRLAGSTLYVTMEPCVMWRPGHRSCAYRRLVFGRDICDLVVSAANSGLRILSF